MISASPTKHPWTLSEWEGLSEHPSPFVRKWVAQNAKVYLDQQSRSPLIKRLLQDEKALVRERACHDLLDSFMPDLAEHYLELALEDETWGQRRSKALKALVRLEGPDLLIQSLHKNSERIQAGHSQSEALVQDLLHLPLALPRLSLTDAEPVAELVFSIIKEAVEHKLFDFQEYEEELSMGLVALMLSHPHPRELVDFMLDSGLIDYLDQEIQNVCGRNWQEELSEQDQEADECEDEAFEFPWDLRSDQLQPFLPGAFLQSWQDRPEKRLELCRKQAETLRRSRSPSPDPAHSPAPVSRDSDLGRLQRMDQLLDIILDYAGRQLIEEDIAEMSALTLLILLAAGQSCWGRSQEEMTGQEMLTILAEDRPKMIQDEILHRCLTQGPKQADTAFRESLLQCSESALADYPSSWGKRVLLVALEYKLLELIPQLMEIFLKRKEEAEHPDISFVETILSGFHSPVVWTEYARQAGLEKSSGSGAAQVAIPGRRDIWFTFLIMQNNPCPEAVDWIEANFQALLPKNEAELLEAVLTLGDQRLIPCLESILAEEELERQCAFQTLCRLHGDPRAFNDSMESELFEAEEDRIRELHSLSQQVLNTLLEQFPFDEQQLRVQLCCDLCQGVYHYKPERIFVYLPQEEGLQFAIDVGGDILCKACQATAEHLDLTTNGRLHISALMMTKLQGKEDLMADVEVFTKDKPSDKQILVLPQGPSVLGEPVRNLKEGLDVYARKLASDPGNPKFLLGRANMFKRYLRYREARQGYLEVLENDPSCLDAMVSLGDMCTRQGQWEEAWEWLQKAYQHVSQGTVLHAEPQAFKRHIVAEYAKEAPKHGLPPVPRTRSRKEKVKRNDPCPCGSGKKYKKCCLNR